MRTAILSLVAALFTLSCGTPQPPDQSAAVAELRSQLAMQNERIMRLEAADAALAPKAVARPTARRRAALRAVAPATSGAPLSLYESPPLTRSVARGFIRGPRGGCYTYSTSGRKQYVNRAICN